MLQIPEHFERLFDDFSRTPPFDIHDKTDPARIVLKLRVVESLLLGNQRLFHLGSVVVQFDVRQALACRSFGDKLKFVGQLLTTG